MTPEPTWRHHVRTADGHTTIELTGEIDMSGATHLQQLLAQAVGAARTVTVDVAGVQFIDSTVISALVTAHNTATANGCHFAVVNPGALVRRVLQITGVLDTLAEDNASPRPCPNP
ncbi:STAS domain-containing protein [Actinoplanes sp. NPDC051475]|uniref:STAS domain-containing protein n=1 Tax=Actinoplanes sp. NPDC051475 TaxID=3157225 RepID=UPI00344FD4F4